MAKLKNKLKKKKQAELERITEIKKRQDKDDLKQANKSLEALKEYGREHNYSPYWAIKRWQILQNYRRK